MIYRVAVLAHKKEEKECHKFRIGNRDISTFYGLPWPGLLMSPGQQKVGPS